MLFDSTEHIFISICKINGILLQYNKTFAGNIWLCSHCYYCITSFLRTSFKIWNTWNETTVTKDKTPKCSRQSRGLIIGSIVHYMQSNENGWENHKYFCNRLIKVFRLTILDKQNLSTRSMVKTIRYMHWHLMCCEVYELAVGTIYPSTKPANKY